MNKINNLIQILILLLLVTLVYKAWFLSGVISAGDNWFYFPSMYENHFMTPYSWYTQALSTGLGGQGFAYVNTYMVVAFLLEIAKVFNTSWEVVSKLGLYLLFLLISSVSSIFLIKKIFPENKFWIISPVVFIFNTYVLMTVGGGQIITALSYSLAPLSLYTVFKLVDIDSKFLRLRYLFCLSLLFFAQAILDLRIAFVTGIASVIYLFISFLGNSKGVNARAVAYFLIAFILVAMICSYWLIPILFYGIDPIEQLGVDYSSSSIVKFLSFATIENSLGLMHPYWFDNIFGKIGFMKPEFLLLPILAFSSLIFLDKERKNKKKVLFFATIGLVGIFLGKGASEPLGNLYIFLFENVPGFQLFRDSIKWYVLIAISYSVLIPYTLDSLFEFLKLRLKKEYAFYLLEILFIIYFIFLIRPAFTNQLNGTFKEREVPKEYVQLNSFLSGEGNFYRTLWIPNTMLFGYYSNLNPQISARDYFRQYSQDKLYKEVSKDEVNNKLDLASVKYVIIPKDTEKEIFLTDRKYDEEKYKDAVVAVDKINWLEKVKSFGDITVYENKDYKDHFWCKCEIENYKYINPSKYEINIKNANAGDLLVFSEAFDGGWEISNSTYSAKSSRFGEKFNSFVLPGGSSKFEVSYLPQSLVQKSMLISITAAAFALVGLTVSVYVVRRRNEKYK